MSSSINKKVIVTSIAAAALGVVSVSAHAFDAHKVTARVRAIYIDPANKSDAGGALSLPADVIKVESKWAPDIDFEYALSDKLALELLLTIPQRHEVTLSGASLGTVTHLPPTLTAKYYFATQAIKPYVGAGLNFTWFTDNGLSSGLDIKRTSFGPALQAGVDVALNKRWSLSFDAKKAWISTEVTAGGAKVTTVHVDPFIYGVGVGYRY